jgi:hypothetical protein
VEQAAAPAATYERVWRAVQGKRNRDGGKLHCCVRVSYEQEEHDDTAYMRARRGSDTEKGRRRGGLRLWLGRPVTWLAAEKGEGQLRRLAWAKEELGQRLQPSGLRKESRQQRPPAGCEAWAGPKGRKPERRVEGDFPFLLFLF